LSLSEDVTGSLFFVDDFNIGRENHLVELLLRIELNLESDILSVSNDLGQVTIQEASRVSNTRLGIDDEESSYKLPLSNVREDVWLVVELVDKVIDLDWHIDEVAIIILKVHFVEHVLVGRLFSLCQQFAQIDRATIDQSCADFKEPCEILIWHCAQLKLVCQIFETSEVAQEVVFRNFKLEGPHDSEVFVDVWERSSKTNSARVVEDVDGILGVGSLQIVNPRHALLVAIVAVELVGVELFFTDDLFYKSAYVWVTLVQVQNAQVWKNLALLNLIELLASYSGLGVELLESIGVTNNYGLNFVSNNDVGISHFVLWLEETDGISDHVLFEADISSLLVVSGLITDAPPSFTLSDVLVVYLSLALARNTLIDGQFKRTFESASWTRWARETLCVEILLEKAFRRALTLAKLSIEGNSTSWAGEALASILWRSRACWALLTGWEKVLSISTVGKSRFAPAWEP
jgi:hypothetical protein